LSLDLGNPQPALEIADRALRQIAADPAPQYIELREQAAAALAGSAHLAMDDAETAIPLLRRAAALAETHLDPERSPQLANALEALAAAYRRTGQEAAAIAGLSRAQAILARHPTLASVRLHREDARK